VITAINAETAEHAGGFSAVSASSASYVAVYATSP
jgi:hypothetical protein